MLPLLALLATALWLAYRRFSRVYDYWQTKGIPCVPGSFPVGSQPNFTLSRRFQGFVMKDLYDQLAPHPFGGIYSFNVPVILLRHPDMVQKVLIKDFSYFRNRLRLVNDRKDMLNQHLFSLEGEKWRALRVKLSPTFTTGKLKNMYTIFEQCAKKLFVQLEKETTENSKIDVKELTGGFTLDLIISCAFGLETSHIESHGSKFRDISNAVVPKTKTIYRMILSIANAVVPKISTILPSFLPKNLEKFLTDVITNTIEHREKNNIKRNDFLDLLIDLKNQGRIQVDKKDYEDDDFLKQDDQDDVADVEVDLTTVLAQCFVFMVAGYETSSSVQSFALYELAVHSEMQDRLRKEIQGVQKTCNGRVTYQALQQMKYLDRVIKETLRKYPTVPILTRLCVKNYRVPDTDFVIEKGTRILIPTYAIHHDARIWRNPETFDPERFNEENEPKIKTCSYLPFGEGPRLCIGMRFGLLQTKIGLFTILSKYKVHLADETPIPLPLASTPATTASKVPILLNFERIA